MRVAKSMRKVLALVLAAAMFLTTDTGAMAAGTAKAQASTMETAAEQPSTTETAPSETVTEQPSTTETAPTETVTEQPSATETAPTETATAPSVTATVQPSVTATAPSVSATPSAVPPAETPPVIELPPQGQDIVPSAVKKIRLCSLGRKKVRLRWTKSAPVSSDGEEVDAAAAGLVLFYRVYCKKTGGGTYRLLAEPKKASYVDKTVRYGQSYRYRVVPVLQAGESEWTGEAATVVFHNRKAVSVTHQKYTYQEMSADIKMLAKNYSDWVDYEVIGKSEDGRNIYDVILGNPNASKTMVVVAAIHAREYMTSLLCMNQIEYYLQNYQKKIDGKKVQTVFQKICVHYITMANPDGVTISQSGIRGIRSSALRSRLRKLAKGGTRHWKANARGVDLNRNFPYLFVKSGRRGSMGFTGSYASSESETKAIVGLIRRLKSKTNLKGVVNYHAMGSIVFGDSRKGGRLRRVTGRMYQLARRTTGYRSAAGYRGSTSLGRGCLREFVMYGERIPSITLEVGRITCPGPIWEFSSIWRRNHKLVYRQARLLAS